MRKGFKIASLSGALAMACGGSAFAAPSPAEWAPTKADLQNWNVSGGTFGAIGVCDAPSPTQTAKYECNPIAGGENGFIQIQLTPKSSAFTTAPPTGLSYILSIVTNTTAGSTGTGITPDSLDFYDVSLVAMQTQMGSNTTTPNVNGIKGIQQLGTAGADFLSNTEVNTGWAAGTGPMDPTIVVSQSLKDLGQAGAGDDFRTAFIYEGQNDATTGDVLGYKMDIGQTIGLQSGTGTESDAQTFAFRQRSGTMQNSAGQMTLGSSTTPESWVEGDSIKAVWVGQKIDLGVSTGTLAGMGSSFGFLAFDNFTPDDLGNPNATDPVFEFGFGTGNSDHAWKWDTAAFGATPCLIDPDGLNDAGDPYAIDPDTGLCVP